jgi:hypothetical protein
MKIKDRFKKIGKSLNRNATSIISDLFGLVALGMIFKGFYIWNPIIAWSAVGGLLLVLSLLMGMKN